MINIEKYQKNIMLITKNIINKTNTTYDIDDKIVEIQIHLLLFLADQWLEYLGKLKFLELNSHLKISHYII